MVDRKRHIMRLFNGGSVLRAGEVALALGVTRQTAHRHLQRLVLDGELITEGAGRSTRYRQTTSTEERRFATAGLEEHKVWAEMSSSGSLLAPLPERARAVLQYATTELVNNVIDHSASPEVLVRFTCTGSEVTLEVRDEGVGIFNHLCNRLGLRSQLQALQELSKGKTTTMPSRHSGEGIFFTSKAAARFEIESGELRWIVDNRVDDMAVGALNPPKNGTVVRFDIDSENVRDLTQVFAEYSQDFEFSKTRTVVRLFAIGVDFVSRSQAKRLVRGLEQFREVVLDFAGVELVGQGFADEVFRVWASAHGEVTLIPTDMSEPIAFMVERAIRRRKAEGT